MSRPAWRLTHYVLIPHYRYIFFLTRQTGISLGLLYWNGDPEDYPNAYGPQGVPTVVDPNHVHDE